MMGIRGRIRGTVNRGLRWGSQYCGRSIWDTGEWDVLVVLDACRYDLMCEVADDYDRIRTVGSTWSNASCSIDWIRRNFVEHPEKCASTGYITANPFAEHSVGDHPSADLADYDLPVLDLVYQSNYGQINGGPVETIPPEAVTDHAISAWRDRDAHGLSKMVIHYMQPHQPFRSRPDWVDIGRNFRHLVGGDEEVGACAWQRARNGHITTHELWAAYRDNLRWVLNDITDRLLSNLEGEVILTADHGNAMGEWGEWAHPPSAISPAVRRVPWVSVDNEDSQTLQPDTEVANPRVSSPDPDSRQDEHLRALGYQ